MQAGTQDRAGGAYAMAGFLATAFAVVGLTGLLAAYIAPLPLERAIAREAVLDRALAVAQAGDAAGLEALRPRLGESAAILPPPGSGAPSAGFAGRVAAERIAMRERLMAEAVATGQRLRALLVVVTIVAAGFGAAMMLVSRRVVAGGRPG